MKRIWYIAHYAVLVILFIIAFFKNVPSFIYNLFHSRKRAYWHPMEYLAREDYDITDLEKEMP